MRIAICSRVSDWFVELKVHHLPIPAPLCIEPIWLGFCWSAADSSHLPSTSTWLSVPSLSQMGHVYKHYIVQKCVHLISFSPVCFKLVDMCPIYSFCVFLGVGRNDTGGQFTTFNWN